MESGILWVCFQREGSGWAMTVQPQGRDASRRTWRTPRDGTDLYRVLFSRDDAAIREGRWRLRVVPHEDVPGDYPQDAPWSALTDPYSQQHVFDHNWTLAEVTHAIGEFTWNGKTVVAGDDALCEALRAVSVPDVEALPSGATPPRDAVLVVGRGARDAAMLQGRGRNCALLVWCREAPATRAEAPEVVAVGSPSAENVALWLARLLTRLRRGDDPERALRNAAVMGSGAQYPDWWLRGPLTQPERRRRPSKPHWREEVDRITFEGNLRGQVKALVLDDESRVFVALVPAGEGAGIDRFSQRDFTLDARASVALDELPKHIQWKPDAPGETLDDLCLACGADDVDDLAQRLGRLPPRGRTLLLRVTHPVVSWTPGDASHLDVPALCRYLSALRVLAEALADRAVRVFVYLPARGLPPALPEDFVRYDARFLLLELGELPSHIERSDLRNWMQREKLELNPAKLEAFLDAVEGKSYEDVIVHLENAYGEKLGA